MEYNKVNKTDLLYFKSILPAERVLTENLEDYCRDEMVSTSILPQVVLLAVSETEISQIVKHASKRRLPVTVRGAGTGLVGACVAVLGGVIICTKLMDKIIELDENNLTMTVEAGVLLGDIAKYAEERGFLYPPDPGEKTATIGGNINTNAGGMRAVKYGVTREYIRALTAVLPNGEVINTGRKVVKNSSGYSIKDLIVGSEGTLAIVTKTVLKIIPKPQHSVSLLVPFGSGKTALSCAGKLVLSGLNPTAIEFTEKQVIIYAEKYLGKAFPDTGSEAYLLVLFDGSLQEVERCAENAARLLMQWGAADVFLVDTDERKEAVWDARGAFLEAIKNSALQFDECDVVVPVEHVADFVEFTKETALQYQMRIPVFGHAGDGNLHIYLCKDDKDDEGWQIRAGLCFKQLYTFAHQLSGLVSGEHGIGFVKKQYFAENTEQVQMELYAAIKKAFDPQNILNPQKIFN